MNVTYHSWVNSNSCNEEDTTEEHAHIAADVPVLWDVLDQPTRRIRQPASKFLEEFRRRYTEPWAYSISLVDGIIQHPATRYQQTILLCPPSEYFLLSFFRVIIPRVVMSLVVIVVQRKPSLSLFRSLCSSSLAAGESGHRWYDLLNELS